MFDLDVTSVVNRCVTVISVTLIASMFCSCISENIKSYIEIAQINSTNESKKIEQRGVGQLASTPEYAFRGRVHNTQNNSASATISNENGIRVV